MKRCSAASVNGLRKRVAEFILASGVEEELWAIWEHIADDNPDAATRVVEAAYATFKTLAATPGLGRLRKFRNPKLKGVRSWLVSGFDNYLFSTALFLRESKCCTFIMVPGTLNRCSAGNSPVGEDGWLGFDG